MTRLQKIKCPLITTLSFLVFSITQAQSAIENASSDAKSMAGRIGYNNYNSQSIFFLMGTIIKYALGFIGIIFLTLTIINGFKWMTAGGNEDAIKKAKNGIFDLIKGLLIIALAYIITSIIPLIVSSIK